MALLSWSGRRQLIYYSVGFAILAVLVWIVWATFFTAAPTCTDGKQDGTELGVDCGGSCALLCTDTARDPTVLWARSFQTGPTAYTVAAYIKNNNPGSGAKNVPYSFQLFDANNSLVIERDGVMNIPPVQTVPIVEPNIVVGNRIVTHVQFAFSQTPPAVWYKVPPVPTLRVTQQNLSADASRLSATLVNDTLKDVGHVAVLAVLFDSQGVARAASKTVLSTLSAQGSVPVVFTWSAGVPDIVRAEITVLPSF